MQNLTPNKAQITLLKKTILIPLKKLIQIPLKKLLVLTASHTPFFQWLPKKLRIVMYHGVGNSSFSEESFDLQMKFVSENFESYWASEAVSLLDSDSKYPSKKPAIILTFDDGLFNNKTTAAPILEKYGLKATFFVCSGLMDGKSMLWNHELRCRLQLKRSEEVRNITIGQCASNSEDDVAEFVELVKRWPEHKVKELLNSLRERRAQPEYTAQMLQDYLLMSGEDVKGLPAVIEIGSHTKTHPILDTLEECEIENQIVNSKTDLSNLLGKDVDVFCYPNGVKNTLCADLVEKNYSLAVTTEDGFASLSDGLNALKRIPSAENIEDMVWRLVRPTA